MIIWYVIVADYGMAYGIGLALGGCRWKTEVAAPGYTTTVSSGRVQVEGVD